MNWNIPSIFGATTSNTDSAMLEAHIPPSAAPGDTVNLSFTLENTGGTAKGYILDVTVPSELESVSRNDDNGFWKQSEQKWLWQTIAPAETVTPSLTVEVPSDTQDTEFTITAAAQDINGVQSEVTESFSVDQAIYSRDFEDVSTGTVPSDFVMVGNTDQQVTSSIESPQGSQVYEMSGSHGECWMAIARFPETADLSLTNNMVIRGQFMRIAGSEGCHSRSGALKFCTSASEEEFGPDRVGLLNFELDKTITAAGETVGTFTEGEWVQFEVEYVRDQTTGTVTYNCRIDGGEVTTVTRDVSDVEDSLSAIQLVSDDFTVAWDDFEVAQATPSQTPSVDATGGVVSQLGGQASIDVSANYAKKLVVDGIWADWDLTADTSGNLPDAVERHGRSVEMMWNTMQETVSPALTVDVPERYVGGEYVLEVRVQNGNGNSDSAEVTITIE